MALHQYNTTQYNTAQYNADAFFWVQALSETLSSSDVLGGNTSMKALADAISSSDAATKYMTTMKADFVFLSDSISKAVQNKGLSESIRTNDWLQITRKGSQWGN